jgi:flagellin
MGIITNHNLMALNAANNLSRTYTSLAKSVTKLSSGLRINTASDDAAGLAVRELMRSDIRVLNQGVRNAQDAINMLATADGAMSVIDEKLIRMSELAEQAATGTYDSVQRGIMNDEFQAMADEITRIATATDFNGIKLLDGSLSTIIHGSERGIAVHFGAGNSSAEDYYTVQLGDATARGLFGNNQFDRITSGVNSVSNANSPLVGNDGAFGFYFDRKGGSTGTYDFGEFGSIVQITSAMSLNDIANKINQGNNARIEIGFASGVGNGDQISIDGVTFEFASAGEAITGDYKVTMAGASAVNEEQAAFLLTKAINGIAGLDFGAIYDVDDASANSAFVTIYAEDTGVLGNDITVTGDMTASGVALTANSTAGRGTNDIDISNDSQNLVGGGERWASAYVAQAGAGEYKLVISSRDLNAGTPTSMYTIGAINFGGDEGFAHSSFTLANASDFESADFSHSSGTAADVPSIATQSNAQGALELIKDAIRTKDSYRAEAGYKSNRLQNTITNLTIQAEMLQSSEAAISDVDVALEMTEFTRNMILAQSGVSMLAQANSIANMALSLLGGGG